LHFKHFPRSELERIMNKLLLELLKGGVIGGETVALDATFVKAYSRRDPHDNSRGKSDPEARVGRNGKTYELGYKLHIAIDAKSELPLAVIAAPRVALALLIHLEISLALQQPQVPRQQIHLQDSL